MIRAIAIAITASVITASAANACSVQLGRRDSCYARAPSGATYYGPGSGVRGRIYDLNEVGRGRPVYRHFAPNGARYYGQAPTYAIPGYGGRVLVQRRVIHRRVYVPRGAPPPSAAEVFGGRPGYYVTPPRVVYQGAPMYYRSPRRRHREMRPDQMFRMFFGMVRQMQRMQGVH